MAALEQVAAEALPPEMSYTYSGLSYQEKNAPSPIPTFVMAVVFVFLLLAAVYESWSLPVGGAARHADRRAGRVLRRLAARASKPTSTCRSAW